MCVQGQIHHILNQPPVHRYMYTQHFKAYTYLPCSVPILTIHVSGLLMSTAHFF